MMARFSSLRPMFRRFSSKHSTAAESNRSESETSDTTAATSAAPSPNLPTFAETPSVAQLREKLRLHQTGIPEELPESPDCFNTITTTTRPNSQQPPISAAGEGGEELAKGIASISQPALPTRSDSLAARQHIQELRESSTHVQPEAGANPILVVHEATPVPAAAGLQLPHDRPDARQPPDPAEASQAASSPEKEQIRNQDQVDIDLASPRSHREASDEHRQGLVGGVNAQIVNRVIDAPVRTGLADSSSSAPPTSALPEFFTDSLPNLTAMLHRKIWVKRPNASATLVQIRQDDLVDDVRDMILRKYANSLGKSFDAPDVNLSVVTRVDQHNPSHAIRVLRPEEEIGKVIDELYPGGQNVEEALIIDVPVKRTPKPSPRHYLSHTHHNMEDYRPHENGTDYFPPMPMPNITHPSLPQNAISHTAREYHPLTAADHPRSISVLNTGQIPPLPSPGGRRHRDREHRPKYGRQHTSSPVILSHPNAGTAGMNSGVLSQQQLPLRNGRPRVDSSSSEHPNGAPPPPPLPSPPAPEAPPTNKNASTPPTPNGSVAPTAHRLTRPRKSRKQTPDKLSKGHNQQADTLNANPTLPNIASILDGSVPPINVLIVEDNIINLRILEGLMKKLKVRWQTAMNGQIAVDKWKAGGFHLVLMDIQMPIMNGLQATKEIRRLERVNGIGVFSSSAPSTPAENGTGTEPNGTSDEGKGKGKEQETHDPSKDKLVMAEGFFKSPVIIVALTASSLQSDRHEALAAGCNDFLTKPVNFEWLERKVKEWGCMQALIDFDGWRKWKDYAAKEEAGKSQEQKQKEKEKEEKERARMEKMAKLQEMKKKATQAKKEVEESGTGDSTSSRGS